MPGMRWREVGGGLGALTASGADISLLQSVIIQVQKIHILAF
jgi:hypothetical protein